MAKVKKPMSKPAEPGPGKDLVTQMQFRIDMQSRLLRSVWDGFTPFQEATSSWKSDLHKATGIPIDIYPEPVLATMVQKETAEFRRVCSSKVIMDTAEMEATPYKVFDQVALQRRSCTDQVALAIDEHKLHELHIAPLYVSAKGECYMMEFYFYSLMIVRH